MSRLGAILALAAVALLAVAVRALFVGCPSYEPVLFAQLYVWLFGTVAFIVLLLWTLRRTGGEHVTLLFVAALVGAILADMAAPTIGEPNYCVNVINYPMIIDLRMPPKVFRCTSVPFQVAGWFAGWGVALWVVMSLRRRAS